MKKAVSVDINSIPDENWCREVGIKVALRKVYELGFAASLLKCTKDIDMFPFARLNRIEQAIRFEKKANILDTTINDVFGDEWGIKKL